MLVLSGSDLATVYAGAYSDRIDPEQARRDAREAIADFIDCVAQTIGEPPHIGTSVLLEGEDLFPRVRV